jgi:nicotinamide mononucleotide transporter
MMLTDWLTENIIEVFGAVTGILYVILEIKRNILLWPLGIVTSAVYIYVFGHSGFYANMGLQGYYLIISIYGWYKWHNTYKADVAPAIPDYDSTGSSSGVNAAGTETDVKRIDRVTAVLCAVAAMTITGVLWFVLDRWTDSPVPVWDGLIASLSVVATWMLTRKYIEQWYVWILANAIAVIVYLLSGMIPTAILFFVYFVMAIIGVVSWGKEQSKVKS